VALRALRHRVSPDDSAAVERCVAEARLDLAGSPSGGQVVLDGGDVSLEIRTPEVSELSSRLAAVPAVRRRLVGIQRDIASRGPVVAEGRDLGTVVFPDAEVKIFLDADPDTRSSRRARELQARGIAASPADVRADLARRDERDRTRADSPLRRAEGALVVDTTGLDLEAQIGRVLAVVRAHPRCPEAWRTAEDEGAGGPVAGGRRPADA
jgi:cytidylate kinase